jgi:excisionase family DNA binding protein
LADLADRWLSVDEVGNYLGVSNDTIYRWIERFNMPACRLGRLWKFKKEQIDQWVEAGGASSDLSKSDKNRDSPE